MPKVMLRGVVSFEGDHLKDIEVTHGFNSKGFQILAEDGNVLYYISLEGSKLRVIAGDVCMQEGVRYSDDIISIYKAHDEVIIEREAYE